MKSFHVLIALGLFSIVSALNAADFTHKASGLTFVLPKGWTCTEKGSRINISNKDKSLSCVGDVIPKESAKAIFADIEKFLENFDGLDDVEVTAGPQKEKVNGLEQAWYEGTASYQDENGETVEIEWDMTIVTGGKAILFLIGTGKLDDNEQAYEKSFESINKVQADTE
jgi:hypothetical protein